MRDLDLDLSFRGGCAYSCIRAGRRPDGAPLGAHMARTPWSRRCVAYVAAVCWFCWLAANGCPGTALRFSFHGRGSAMLACVGPGRTLGWRAELALVAVVLAWPAGERVQGVPVFGQQCH